MEERSYGSSLSSGPPRGDPKPPPQVRLDVFKVRLYVLVPIETLVLVVQAEHVPHLVNRRAEVPTPLSQIHVLPISCVIACMGIAAGLVGADTHGVTLVANSAGLGAVGEHVLRFQVAFIARRPSGTRGVLILDPARFRAILLHVLRIRHALPLFRPSGAVSIVVVFRGPNFHCAFMLLETNARLPLPNLHCC